MGDSVTQVENVIRDHDETLSSATGRLRMLPIVEVDSIVNSWPWTE